MTKHQTPLLYEGPWLRGSIRRKLSLFVVIMSLILVGLFWFFSVFLLQPAYNAIIRRELSATLSTAVGILNRAQSEGMTMMAQKMAPDGSSRIVLADEVVALLQEAVDDGGLNLNNRCLDIGSPTAHNLLLHDGIAPGCVLHPSHESGISAQEVQFTPERDGTLITRVRGRVLTSGYYYMVLNSGQMVMGDVAGDGLYTVVVSANLERIPQAVAVLKQLMVPVSGILILLSVMAAWGFSRWFTRPLNRLSAAAKEMTRGNYNVSVPQDGDDEISALAKDFNTMAREVKRSADLQKDLLANISHDLRTPLTLIKGYAETVRDLSGDDPKKRSEQLSVIVDETDRLSTLVNSVLELSRMSSGNEKPVPVQFDMYQLADEVAFRYDAISQQQGYNFHFGGDEGCEVVADPAMVERALHNLLGNAMKHVGEDGYIGLEVRHTLDGRVRVEVIDHGPGIDPKDQPYLFDRYYRARSDAGKPGTGLGLSITKAIFEALGFTYGVYSKPGKGAIFWFEAPRAPGQKPPAPL